MFAKLAEIFHPAAGAKSSTGRVGGRSDDAVLAVDRPECRLAAAEIDHAFTGLLLGVNSPLDQPMASHEKTVLKAIVQRYLKSDPADCPIPRLPSVIPRVLQALRDEETDAPALAKILSADMTLVADVLQLANSAYYNRNHKYATLEQATVSVGFSGVRQLIMGAALRPILDVQSGHFVRLVSRYLWRKSMLTAQLADVMAQIVEQERFHSYLAGLFMQISLSVLCRELDECLLSEQAPRSLDFYSQFEQAAGMVSVRISQQWDMPEAVTACLQALAKTDVDTASLSRQQRLVWLADKAAKVRLLDNNGCLKAFDDFELLTDDLELVSACAQARQSVTD